MSHHPYGLGPVTPDPVADALRLRETPLTASSSVPYDAHADLSASSPPSADQSPDGCRTPSNDVFDSFAPGPDDLNMAPKRHSRSVKTFLTSSTGEVLGSLGKSRVSRVLNFDDDDGDEHEEAVAANRQEMEFLEFVYEDLLNAILLNQTDNCSAKDGAISSPKTPRCVNIWINDPWDTYPSAPIKPRSRAVASDTLGSLCRKLEF